MILDTMPIVDETIDNFEWGEISGGSLLVNYDESGCYDESTGETHNVTVNGAEVVGLHIGGLVVLSPDEMIAMHSKDAFQRLEQWLLEKRREVV